MAIYLPTAASFLLTENCNLRCTYCFEHHNKSNMNKETAQAAIDWLISNTLTNKENSFSVMLFGGEPLLNIDTIEYILEYGTRAARNNGIQMIVSMVTNATIMNERIYNLFAKYKEEVNLNIQLSVDGIPEVHDTYRLTKDKKGSFYMIKKNIPIFQRLYGNNPNDKRLSIHGCINKATLPYLYENYKFFRRVLNFKQIWFLPISEEKWDANDVKIYDEQNAKIYKDYIKELGQSKDLEDSYNYAPFSRYTCIEKRSSKPCGAGNSFVTITASGDIFPCHEIYFNDPEKDTLLGNVNDGILDFDRRRIFIEYEESDLNCKSDCPNTQCYRCIAANWVHNGSLFSQTQKFYCDMSSVDLKYQLKLKKMVEEMCLNQSSTCQSCVSKNSNSNQELSDCLCNTREGTIINGCDVVVDQMNCQSGNNPNNPECMCDVLEMQDTPANKSVASIEISMNEFKNITQQLQAISQQLIKILQRCEN